MSAQIDLSGKVALVTGAGVGIGREIALTLAGAGADIALTYLTHSADELVEEIKDLGREAAAFRLDVTRPTDVERMVEEVAARFGQIDILVNNAGGLVGRVPLGQMTDKHWNTVLALNLTSTFYCTRSVMRHMGQEHGRVINISSLAALTGGGPGYGAYAAAKAGIHALTVAFAKELAPRGITVNCVAPGLILETPFHETFTSKEDQQTEIESTALGRPGRPSDVAGPVLFLASDLSSFITGDVIDVNGGRWFG
ncbi:MAG: glucose 1-dehydrogenase [Candidatus Limnocylindrales bacterium]|jgi:3-oxoacyl-[acyl-carrier protein] reductase